MNCIKCQKEHNDNIKNKIEIICCDIKQINNYAPSIYYYTNTISPVTLESAM